MLDDVNKYIWLTSNENIEILSKVGVFISNNLP
jgi:hypothetical protein